MNYTNETHRIYIQWLVSSRYSDNVRKNYTYYSSGLIGKDLNQDTINSICQQPKSHAVYRSFLKTIVQCFTLHLEIPKIRGRKKGQEIIYYTNDEMHTILSNVRSTRLKLLIRLMYENGLRVSEAISLKKNNFDMVNRRVKGIGKGNKPFDLKIQDTTFSLLQVYLPEFENDSYIFHYEGIKHQRHRVLYEVKKELKTLLPHKQTRELFNHAFRHTTGTYLREKGFDLREIQTYLRHEQLETVARYTSVEREVLEKKMDGVF